MRFAGKGSPGRSLIEVADDELPAIFDLALTIAGHAGKIAPSGKIESMHHDGYWRQLAADRGLGEALTIMHAYTAEVLPKAGGR